jgi:hypothetical protein
MPSPKAGGKCHEEEASRLPVPVLRRQDHNAGRERIAISDSMRELIEEVAETRPQAADTDLGSHGGVLPDCGPGEACCPPHRDADDRRRARRRQ